VDIDAKLPGSACHFTLFQAFVEPRIRLTKFGASCGKGFFFPHFGLML
jgi:hypothetical protein